MNNPHLLSDEAEGIEHFTLVVVALEYRVQFDDLHQLTRSLIETQGLQTAAFCVALAPAKTISPSPALSMCTGGPLLGLFDCASYAHGDVEINPGDRLVVYTDGATELTNEAGKEFGDERLVATVKDRCNDSAGELQQALVDSLYKFGGGNFEDDVTLLAISADATQPASKRRYTHNGSTIRHPE